MFAPRFSAAALCRAASAARPAASQTVRSMATNSRVEGKTSSLFKIGVAALAAAGFGAGVSVSLLAKDATPDYERIRKDIADLIDPEPLRGPLFVRLAWHSAGTYDKASKGHGSNGGTMRFNPESNHGANAGLGVARYLLESVKEKNPEITYADLYTLAGAVAIEELGGPEIKWRPGRTDAISGKSCPPDGRLPDAAQGSDHIRTIFYRMGFNDREIVALLGAHAIGFCHEDRSGFKGPWTRSPTTFSNEYFRELLESKWTPKKWDGPMQYEDQTGELMMLPADLALIKDKEFRQYVELYAKDEKVFFEDFAAAFAKLLELGVNFPEEKAKGGFFKSIFG